MKSGEAQPGNPGSWDIFHVDGDVQCGSEIFHRRRCREAAHQNARRREEDGSRLPRRQFQLRKERSLVRISRIRRDDLRLLREHRIRLKLLHGLRKQLVGGGLHADEH